MAKWFSGNGFAWAENATRCSISVRTVTADNVIAASPAGDEPASISIGMPTTGTRTVRKGEMIIATGNASTGNAERNRA
jgi:hypothetical protein